MAIPSGQLVRPFTEEQISKESMNLHPQLMRPIAAKAERNEREGLMAIKAKYKGAVPDEMFWEIYEFVKRDAQSKNGGRKKTKKRRNRRQRKSRRL